MGNDRIKYSFSIALKSGIYFALGFSLFDIFSDHIKGILLVKKIIFNFCVFSFISFIWGYFEYKSYIKKIEERDKALAPHEFRCFKCEALIDSKENKCPKCGWTWK